MSKPVPTFEQFSKLKPFVYKPHPMQHRLDEFRSIPSYYYWKKAQQ
ncbi:hypothetical protein UFOVP139_21 [uncultured Caudovirales phage]|uniref:Uncharacterized protein n=1 Tax=uncultured Caudovirales phage TaxID=2100421 RepID=A0A6J5LGG3_9CAUD|nr:hypothetical protein UFOVP139_21 [uncultured Caudovirales phage]